MAPLQQSLTICFLSKPEVEDCAEMGAKDDYSGSCRRRSLSSDGGQASQKAAKDLAANVRKRKERNIWVTGEMDFVDVVSKIASVRIFRKMLRDQAARAEEGGREEGLPIDL